MKIFFKINILFLGILLTSNCFGMEKTKDFDIQLKDFLTGNSQYPLEKYKEFVATYEKVIIEKIQNNAIVLNNPIITKFPNNGDYTRLLIHRVTQIGNLKILKAILKKDPSLLDIPDSEGQTPLLHACEYNNISCVEYLLEHKAAPRQLFCDLKQYWHAIHPMFTIIHIAAEKHPVDDVIKILGLIIKNYPEFLTYEYKNTTCLGCIETLLQNVQADLTMAAYPTSDYEQKRKTDLEYLNKIKKFIESKTRLRRFSMDL